MNHKVTLGTTAFTVAALDNLNLLDAMIALERHESGDWGDVCASDEHANEVAMNEGGRLLSVYHDRQGTKFWIITERDRSSTTIMLPEDY
ncbi:MAG: hypothetical protein IT435_04340 [Phycisphaerales bacterium]|nr:hypothetical protein [Phycisphaerales bacterium]